MNYKSFNGYGAFLVTGQDLNVIMGGSDVGKSMLFPDAKSIKSVAIWPEGTLCCQTEQRTDDNNGSYECAAGICRRLRREGFGGNRQIFPLEVFVEITKADGTVEKVSV